MKRFAFRLETLLRIRGLYEEEAERRFREALRRLALAVDRLEELRNELAAIVGELLDLRRRGTGLQIQMLFQNYIVSLRRRIDVQLAAVRTAEIAVERRREELLERMKERKTMDQLKVRDYDRYLVELRRFEQKVVDDLATLRGGGFDLESFQGAAL